MNGWSLNNIVFSLETLMFRDRRNRLRTPSNRKLQKEQHTVFISPTTPELIVARFLNIYLSTVSVRDLLPICPPGP